MWRLQHLRPPRADPRFPKRAPWRSWEWGFRWHCTCFAASVLQKLLETTRRQSAGSRRHRLSGRTDSGWLSRAMKHPRTDPWATAVAHLIARDSRLVPLIERAGPCRLRPRRNRFATLVRAIIGQQISTRAAASIDARLRALTGGPHDAMRLLELGEAGLRQVGLSGMKARYVLNLAEVVGDGRLPLNRIGTWDDQTIVTHLTA